MAVIGLKRAGRLALMVTVSASASGPIGAHGEPGAAQRRLRFSRERQIELAMRAAPPHISEKATIHVLEPKGYVVARTGSNGFHCLVEHKLFDTYEPTCYDPEGSATILQARLLREELRAQGLDEAEVTSRIEDGYKSGRLKAPRKPGFAYMMGTDQRVEEAFTKQVVPVPPHLMFYVPYATAKDFGGQPEDPGKPGAAPLLLWEGQPDAFLIVNTTGPAQGHQHR